MAPPELKLTPPAPSAPPRVENHPFFDRVERHYSRNPEVIREQAALLDKAQDAILVRPMAYVTLTIDHRVVDGHQTNAWLTRFVEVLEGWSAD